MSEILRPLHRDAPHLDFSSASHQCAAMINSSSKLATLFHCSLAFAISQEAHANVAPSSSSGTSEKLIFMRESDSTKQIVLANADGAFQKQITAGDQWHLYPDISSDASKIVYSEGSDAKTLSIVLVDTKNPESKKIIAGGSGLFLHAKFSGDASIVAFSGPVGEKSRQAIGILNIHNLEIPPTVIPSDSDCYFPAPSSNGKLIAFQRNISANEKRITLYDTQSGSFRDLSEARTVSMSPAISPDNRFVAYTHKENDNWDIVVADLINGSRAKITGNPAKDYAPAFKSDGSVVFASDRSGHFSLYQISKENFARGEATVSVLVDGVGAELYSPNFSGDGSIAQKTLAPVLEPARSSFGVARLGSKIYIVGGHQGHEHTYPPESFLDALEIYDTNSDSWSRGAPRPVKAHGFGIVAHDHYIYAFGGFAYSEVHKPKWKSLDQIDRYDTRDNTWQTVGHLASPRSSNAVVKLGTKVYLIGGWDSTPNSDGDREGSFLRSIEIFDLETERNQVASFTLPNPLRRAFSAVELNGKIILAGGIGIGSSHFELLDNVTELEVNTGTFKELAPLPFATFAPALGSVGNSLYLFGGMFKLGELEYEYVNHAFVLPDLAGKWTHTGRYLQESKGFSQVVDLGNSTLGILGGHNYTGQSDAPVATFESFRP